MTKFYKRNETLQEGSVMFGSMPSQKLMNRKPEDLSVQSALYAWNVGFRDGSNNATHALFDGDGAEGLQMFYDDGYERGERERSVVDRMESRHGSPDSETGETAEKTVDAGAGIPHSEEANTDAQVIEIVVSPPDRNALEKTRDGAVITVAAIVVATAVIYARRTGHRNY